MRYWPNLDQIFVKSITPEQFAATMTGPLLRSAPRPRVGSARGPSGWLAVPALVIFAVFALVPLVGVVALSLTRWDGLGPISWDGLNSWTRALADPVTLNAILG